MDPIIYPPEVTAAFQAFIMLTPEQRLLITCWFCLSCGRHLGPETGGACPTCDTCPECSQHVPRETES